MAAWPIPAAPQAVTPSAIPNAGVIAGAPTQAQVRNVETGGTPENRWEYNLTTQLYIRWWAVTYCGLWFDGQRTRPVRWMLEDMERMVVDGFDVWKETWSWVYLE